MSAASMYRPFTLGLRRRALVVAVAWLGMSCPISLSSLHAQAAPAVDPRVTEAGAIEGTLFPPPDSHGKSAEGITVTINETGQSVDTDKHGKYSFENVKPGTYTLIAAGSGYSRLRITDVVVKPNRVLTLSSEAMPMVMKDGEVQVMAEVVVNANKDIQTLEKLVVTGSKPAPFTGTSNLDLPRTKDDVQPYYIWDSTQIENSGAADLQGFFQTMVPMDTNRYSAAQGLGNYNNSNISLGGLSGSGGSYTGTQNTEILVDGLPLPSLQSTSVTFEPDLNGIPLAAIDHIEVLTGSASAIYGASGAAGVINIILKHDYSGVELGYHYDNTFGTDSPVKGATLTAGGNLEGGKTNYLLSASYQTSKPLTLQDRTQIVGPYQNRFFQGYPGGELAYIGLTNSSGAFTTSSSGYLNTPIVTSSAGTPLFPGSSATTVEVPAGYVGGSGLAPLQANIGNFNLAHPNAADASGIGGQSDSLGLGTSEKAIDLLLRRQMTGWLESYVRFLDSSNIGYSTQEKFLFSGITVPATVPGNPFGQTVKISGLETSDLGDAYATDLVSRSFSIGAKVALPHGWKADIDYTWGSTALGVVEPLLNTTALQAAVTDGSVNLITDLGQHPITANPTYMETITVGTLSSTDALQVKAAGPLVRLWAGTPTLALGIEHAKSGANRTEETLQSPGDITVTGVSPSTVVSELIYFPGYSSPDNSAYAELELPLIGRENGIFGVRQLEIQAAGRFDSVKEFVTSPLDHISESLVSGATANLPDFTGTTVPEPFTTTANSYHSTNGTIGFKYKPVDDGFFRWSYSTAFVPPVSSQLVPPVSSGTQTQPTGAYPGVPTTSPWSYQSIADPLLNATYDVPVITGGNPNLKPETSHGLDWGVVFEPTFVKGLRVSLDYTRVTKYNDIIAPSVASLIANAAQFPGTVTRGTPNAGQTVGPIVLINDTYINAPETTTSSYNLEMDYTFQIANAGIFKLSAIGNSWQHYEIQSTIGGPFVEQLSNPDVSTISGGLGSGVALAKFKGNLGLDWTRGPFSAGWLVRYVGPYTAGSYYGYVNGVPSPDFYYTYGNNGWISGQIYHDVYIGYHFGKAAPAAHWWSRALANTKLQLGVANLFDHIPPYDAVDGLGLPLYSSAYGSVRLAEYRFSVKKAW